MENVPGGRRKPEGLHSDLIRGNIDTIILKCLKIGDMYGLEIINHIKKASYGTYILKQPTLYSALKRLEGKRYITSYWRDSAIGGRRHYYQLTETGKESFADKKDQWSASKDVIDTIVEGTAKKTISASEQEQVPVADTQKNLQKKSPVLLVDDTPPVLATLPQTVTMGMSINPYNPYMESDEDYMTLPFKIIENAIDNAAESEDDEDDDEVLGLTIANARIPQKLHEQDDIPPLLRYVAAEGTLAPMHNEITAPAPIPNTFAKYLSPDEYAAITTVKTGASAKTAKIANYDINIRPFIKHYSDKKRGDFHYISKLRLMAAFMVTLALIACLVVTYNNLKSSYSADEHFFFVLGYTMAGLYFAYYFVRFITSPHIKKAVQNELMEHAIRFGASIGSIIAILAINILAGLTHVNSPDFLVFWVVPCILAAVIYFECVVQSFLRKTNLFVA